MKKRGAVGGAIILGVAAYFFFDLGLEQGGLLPGEQVPDSDTPPLEAPLPAADEIPPELAPYVTISGARIAGPDGARLTPEAACAAASAADRLTAIRADDSLADTEQALREACAAEGIELRFIDRASLGGGARGTGSGPAP